MANLDGLNWYGDWTIEDKIIYNVINFLKWGLLEIGAYYNISKDQVNYNGANESILQPVTFYGSGGIANYTVYKGLVRPVFSPKLGRRHKLFLILVALRLLKILRRQ